MSFNAPNVNFVQPEGIYSDAASNFLGSMKQVQNMRLQKQQAEMAKQHQAEQARAAKVHEAQEYSRQAQEEQRQQRQEAHQQHTQEEADQKHAEEQAAEKAKDVAQHHAYVQMGNLPAAAAIAAKWGGDQTMDTGNDPGATPAPDGMTAEEYRQYKEQKEHPIEADDPFLAEVGAMVQGSPNEAHFKQPKPTKREQASLRLKDIAGRRIAAMGTTLGGSLGALGIQASAAPPDAAPESAEPPPSYSEEELGARRADYDRLQVAGQAQDAKLEEHAKKRQTYDEAQLNPKVRWNDAAGNVVSEQGLHDARDFNEKELGHTYNEAAARLAQVAPMLDPFTQREAITTAHLLQSRAITPEKAGDMLKFFLGEKNDLTAKLVSAQNSARDRAAALRLSGDRVDEARLGHDIEQARFISGEMEKTAALHEVKGDLSLLAASQQKLHNLGKSGFEDAGALYSTARGLTGEKGPMSVDDVKRSVVGKAGVVAAVQSWLEGKVSGKMGPEENRALAGALQRVTDAKIAKATESSNLTAQYMGQAFPPEMRALIAGKHRAIYGGLPGYQDLDAGAGAPLGRASAARKKGKKGGGGLKVTGATIPIPAGEKPGKLRERIDDVLKEVDGL